MTPALQDRRGRILVAMIGLSLLILTALIGAAFQSGAGLRAMVVVLFVATGSVGTVSIIGDLRRAWRIMREHGL